MAMLAKKMSGTNHENHRRGCGMWKVGGGGGGYRAASMSDMCGGLFPMLLGLQIATQTQKQTMKYVVVLACNCNNNQSTHPPCRWLA